MSAEINAQEVLKYLNELGYCGITGRQLKEFIRDLKKLIKYDQKKHSRRENQENVQSGSLNHFYHSVQEEQNISHYDGDYDYDDIEDVAVKPVKQLNKHDQKKHSRRKNKKNVESSSLENLYYSVRDHQNKQQYDYDNIENVAAQINTQSNDEDNNEKYLSEVFNTLHVNSTVSSRGKLRHKKSKSKDRNIISVEILKPKPSKPLLSSGTQSGVTKLNEVFPRPASCPATCRTKESSETCSCSCMCRSKSGDCHKAHRDNLRPRGSFIKPRHPVKPAKSDPVALYHQYQEQWKKQKLPGENKRYDLRWAIRERMLGEPDILPRPSKDNICKKIGRI